MKPQYDFKIEVDGEQMLACDILDDLSDYFKACVIELNPGEETFVSTLDGKALKVSRPYPTLEEEMEAYELGGRVEDSLNHDR
jgi:hypothetical protein